MASFAEQHNVASFISQERAADNASLTAGGAGDNTQVVGQIIDTTLYSHPLSIAILILWKAVLGASATLSIKSLVLEHGDQSNLSDAANLSAPADVVVGTGAATLRGIQKYAVDLAGCKRYIRLKYTPDLSAANTDTAECAAGFVFGGTDIAS